MRSGKLGDKNPSIMERHQINKLEFASDLENISLVESYIDRLKDQYDIEDTIYGNMMLAVIEAVTNAIEHGNNCDCKKNVCFTTYKEEKSLRFCIEDQGCGFDPAKVPDPTLPENIEEPCGRGVFLIRNLADLVVFDQSGSRIEIQFRI